MTELLDLTGPLPSGRLVVEASAGTGKTYSLSALVVRHVAEGMEASSLLVVTFTRAAAAELRDRTRSALVKGLAALDAGAAPDDQPWMSVLLEPAELHDVRRERLRRAIATFDDATITTIHGFCQQALRQLGLRAGTGLQAELGDSTAEIIDEVCRDLLVAELCVVPSALSWNAKKDSAPARVFTALREAVAAMLGNPGATAVPDPSTATPAKADSPERLGRWVELVHEGVHEVGVRRRARHELGYDDLVTGLRDAVTNPVTGPTVVAELAERYRLVLVDEFQDTDPVQWQIFATAFSGHLVTVGDPKQAIYRFRGADVQAYLQATDGVPTVHLGTNFRSDAQLVRATNELIRDVQLGDPRIVGSAVEPSPRAAQNSLSPGLPMQIRWVPDSPQFRPTRDFSGPLARRAIVGDVVQQIVELLTAHRIDDHLVRPGDIAILVPSHSVAEQMVRALDRADIPSVRTRTGSVLQTPAADQWSLLLAALERPSHAPTVRAAGLSVFLHRAAADLDPQLAGADLRLAEMQRQCARWAELLATQPLLAWYDRVRADSHLVSTVLGAPGGERRLTDIDHVAELLATELTGMGNTAAAARRILDRMRAEAAEGDEPDAQMRRIDSDAQAVQVTTLHGSKGLEYPIVLLPFSWQVSPARGAVVYNDHDTGRRMVDIASRRGWDGPDLHTVDKGRKHHAAVGERGDRLRLLYVGLTRAEHRTIVWWAPAKEAERSALNVLLFDRDDTGRPLNSQPDIHLGPRGGFNSSLASVTNPTPDQVEPRLEQLRERSGGLIDVARCRVDLPRVRWVAEAPDEAVPLLAVADARGRVVEDRAWRRWSFTSITRTLDQVWTPTPSIIGGTDEPEEPDEPEHHDDRAASPARPTGVPLADVLAGASFGTLVHTVLERVDPAHPDFADHLRDEVQLQLQRDRLDVQPDVLVAGLLAAVHTSLGPLADGRRLVDIPAADRLAELDFDLPLWSGVGRVSAADVGAVLLDTLPADDPQRDYAQQLADGRFEVQLAGFLQGSIDAVLRVPDATNGHRYLVVDYKTNRLHARGAADPLAAYHPDLLPGEMAHHDYPLQSMLYSVAVHRYLRWRLPDYRPEQHLGGIAYLFVRGMVGDATPTVDGHPYGVFSWRPPAATVVALDRLLATGARS